MSFFTSLTGLNAATTQLSVTSNNIANAGTTGFKRSRSDFGDIFATSPLQKASTVVGQGTALKQVTQEFSQGNIELSGNSLDLAVTGEGFFPLKSSDGQDLFTRNGSFLLDEQNTVVNSAGQYLKVASVDSLGKADFKANLIPLVIAPKTVGEAVATSNIDFAINFPAESLPITTVDENNLEQIKEFDPEDPSTYAKSAAITIYDENGNDFLVTFYYRRVEVATAQDPFNKWQTHVVLDGQEITPALGQATSSKGTPLFVDKYGNIVPEDELPVVLNDNLVFSKFVLDDLSDPVVSSPATVVGGFVSQPYLSDETGVNFAAQAANKVITVDTDALEAFAAGTGSSRSAATVTISTDTISIDGHGYTTGQYVDYDANGGDAIGGLIDGGRYYAVVSDANSIQLAATEKDATGVDTEGDILVLEAHDYSDGQVLEYLNGGGDSIGGLTDSVNYYAIVVSDNEIQLAADVKGATGIDTADDQIALEAHGLQAGDAVSYGFPVGATQIATSTGSLEASATYFAAIVDEDTIQLTTSKANALGIDTVNNTVNLSTLVDAGLSLGDAVTYSKGTGSSSIGGLTSGSTYYVQSIDANNNVTLGEVGFVATTTNVDAVTDTITLAGDFDTGSQVTYTESPVAGALGLTSGTDYYVQNNGDGTYGLAATFDKLAGLDIANNVLYIQRGDGTAHGLSRGDSVTFTASNDAVIGGLEDLATYYVDPDVVANAIKFYTDYDADTDTLSGEVTLLTFAEDDLDALDFTLASGSEQFYRTAQVESLTVPGDGESHTFVSSDAMAIDSVGNGAQTFNGVSADAVDVIDLVTTGSDLQTFNSQLATRTAIDLTTIGNDAQTLGAVALTQSVIILETAGNASQVLSEQDEVRFTLTDSAGDELAVISSTVQSQMHLDMSAVNELAADDVIGLTFTEDDAAATTTTIEITVAESDLQDANGNDYSDAEIVQNLINKLNSGAIDAASGYNFATFTNSSSSVLLGSRIVVSRQDGNNFKVEASSNHELSGTAAVLHNEDVSSPDILSGESNFTVNGRNLATSGTVTLEYLTEALHQSAAGTGFEVTVNSDGELVFSSVEGVNFRVEMSELPASLQNSTPSLFVTDGGETSLEEGVQASITIGGRQAIGVADQGTGGTGGLLRAFDLTIDEDPLDRNATDPVTIDLSALADLDENLSGEEIANVMTQEINRQYGDQRYFDLSSAANRQFRITFDENPKDTVSARVVDIYIPTGAAYTEKSLGEEITSQLRSATGTHITVEYSRSTKGFVYTPESNATEITISNVPANASLTGSAVPNSLFGLPTLSTEYTLDSRGRYPAEVIPQGDEILTRDSGQQRYGITVEFLPNTDEGGTGGRFTISSGTTGDSSAIRIENMSDIAKTYFGFNLDLLQAGAILDVEAEQGSEAKRGVSSSAAKVFGKPVSIDPEETFYMDDLTNTFTVTVDNVTESFTLPVGNYNLNSFKNALQNRINAMEDGVGNSISGVTVNFDQVNEIFTFSSGTTGDSSFFQIQGASRFGLEGIDSSVGQTSTYRPPNPSVTAANRPIYVTKDENGVFREYSSDSTSGLSSLPGSREVGAEPEYRPLFLDKGELTFDTSGNLISPLGGISLDNVVIGGSGNTLNIDIDYGGSTQFSGDFSVNQQSQNGQPNGSLVAVDIADDGLVTASYSNGTQDLKGKIVLATFSTPNGLRQLGDSTFLESNESGTPTLGEPGGAGFGTIRAGARERANVDLTSELVDLITAQRNFQANAKAIETSSTLTSTIINIRS